MPQFKKLNTKLYPKNAPPKTEDNAYWAQLGKPVLIKEFGLIDYIDFSPIEPHHFAVTCSVRIQVYNPITKLVAKNLSRFRENAYGGSFRSDGRLLCAGGEEMNVKMFDVASKSLLRLFRGHAAAVHRTFFAHAQPHIVSFGDDRCVKVWDIPTESEVISYSNHTDYIRAGALTPIVPHIVLSGGYDHVVQMYDTRTRAPVLSVDHGAPIESLLFLPAGGIFVSAGGTQIKIWDTFAGGKLLGSLAQHHKTVTCLRLGRNGTRMLSAGLDRHVKIYDVSTFKVVHSLDYPNAVLSVGVSKEDTVVAGLVDGLVCVSRKEEGMEGEKKEEKEAASFQYRIREGVDTVVPEFHMDKTAKYDHCLKKFKYARALDMVLQPYTANKNPHVTVALVQELMRRGALARALQGRETRAQMQFIRFVHRNVTDYRFARVLLRAFGVFLDVVVEGEVGAEVAQALNGVLMVLRREVEVLRELGELQGALTMLLGAAGGVDESGSGRGLDGLVPSEDAEKNLVVNLT